MECQLRQSTPKPAANPRGGPLSEEETMGMAEQNIAYAAKKRLEAARLLKDAASQIRKQGTPEAWEASSFIDWSVKQSYPTEALELAQQQSPADVMPEWGQTSGRD